MTGSSTRLAIAVALVVSSTPSASSLLADGPALKLHATVVGASGQASPLTIELLRWSTDGERAPLIAALKALPPPPPRAPTANAGGRAGRGARGARAAGPPPSPMERLTSAIKAAPTVGFIWGDGPTGYSIKYAWRVSAPGSDERIVLATDRRLGAHEPAWPKGSGPASGADFTVLDMRIDAKGAGEARASLMSAVVVDASANALALDSAGGAPALLKVTR